MATIQWAAIDPATGLVVAELPGVRCESSLTTMMGATGGTVNVNIPLPDRLPSIWRQATQPHRVLLVAQADDDRRTILWAGVPIVRTTGSGPDIGLTLVDVHGYADRQYNNHERKFDGLDAATAASTLIEWAMWDYGPRFLQVTPTGRTLADFVQASDESTYGALVRLAALGLCEWAITFQWGPAGGSWGNVDRLVASLVIAPRIGRVATATVEPYLLTDVDWTRTEDWSNGRGATNVVAVGQSSGDGEPPAEAYPWPPTDRLRLMETVQVDSDNRTVLRDTARRRYAELSQGATVFDVSVVVADSDLLLAHHVGVGDDVVVDLTNPDLPELDYGFKARMVGWILEPDAGSGEITTMKPILVDRES